MMIVTALYLHVRARTSLRTRSPSQFSCRRITRSLWPANAMKEERRQRESKESGPLEVVFNLEAPRFSSFRSMVLVDTIRKPSLHDDFMLFVRYIPCLSLFRII